MPSNSSEDRPPTPPEDKHVLFVDTCVLLNYRGLDQLKPVDFFAASTSIRLIICPQVIDELDGKKEDAYFGDRASKALQMIESWGDAPCVLQPGVTGEVFAQPFFVDSAIPSSASGDARILQQLQTFVEREGVVNVAVLTEDVGMKLRCRAHSIATISLDRALRLPNPRTELQKKHERILEELEHERRRRPVIIVLSGQSELEPTDQADQVACRVLRGSRVNIDAVMTQYLADHPPAVASALEGLAGVPQVSVFDYNAALKAHFVEYRDYLHKENAFREVQARTVPFYMFVRNIGASPAKRLNIIGHLPEKKIERVGLYRDFDDWAQKPEEPTAPQRNLLPAALPSFASGLTVPLKSRSYGRAHSNVTFVADMIDGLPLINIQIETLQHNKDSGVTIGPFFMTFLPSAQISNVGITCTILAENLPDKVEFQALVLVHS